MTVLAASFVVGVSIQGRAVIFVLLWVVERGCFGAVSVIPSLKAFGCRKAD